MAQFSLFRSRRSETRTREHRRRCASLDCKNDLTTPLFKRISTSEPNLESTPAPTPQTPDAWLLSPFWGLSPSPSSIGSIDDVCLSLSRPPSCTNIWIRPTSSDSAVGLDYDSSPRSSVLTTPSVVITDHSGNIHVAHANCEFSFDLLPDSLSSSLSCRKPSDCSTCSSLSTIGGTSPPDVFFDSTFENAAPENVSSDRRLSDSSTLTADEDDSYATSNWRKVRNVVQWAPFVQTYKRQKYPWVQLAGHQGNFKAGFQQGTILKKFCSAEEKALNSLMKDSLRTFVPKFTGVVEGGSDEKYLQMEDLLGDFCLPCVMDVKMGVRTYLEEELAKAREKPKLRKDMYDKMIQIDLTAPTEAEHCAKAVTKPRYMVWRETISSTSTLGFRVEGIRKSNGTSRKDFKTARTREQVLSVFNDFLEHHPNAAKKYLSRLQEIRKALETSKFFHSHELVGSSLLFIHDDSEACVWMIDFAKTIPLPNTVEITHKQPWIEGTHEDGYLIGLDNLISLFESTILDLCQNGEVKSV